MAADDKIQQNLYALKQIKKPLRLRGFFVVRVEGVKSIILKEIFQLTNEP